MTYPGLSWLFLTISAHFRWFSFLADVFNTSHASHYLIATKIQHCVAPQKFDNSVGSHQAHWDINLQGHISASLWPNIGSDSAIMQWSHEHATGVMSWIWIFLYWILRALLQSIVWAVKFICCHPFHLKNIQYIYSPVHTRKTSRTSPLISQNLIVTQILSLDFVLCLLLSISRY